MDYEKKYKEALETARKINSGEEVAAPEGWTICEVIFPELKESEDEKTRKDIINFVKSRIAGFPECERFVTWLEKQGQTFVKKDVDDAWLKGISGAKHKLEKQSDSSIKWNKNIEGNKPQVNHSVLMKTTHGIAEGEWKGEYWYQYRWSSSVNDSDVLSWMELSDFVEGWHNRESSTWGEEDEMIILSIEQVMNCASLLNIVPEKVDKIRTWLESLKQRIGK